MPTSAAHEGGAIAAQTARLVRRSEVLRQIHSDKRAKVEKRHRRTTLGLVAATAAVGFFGFTGTERLQKQLAGAWSLSLDAVTMLYNIFVLLTVLMAIVIVVYRLPERAAEHQRAIQSLTEFILDTETQMLLAQGSANPLTTQDLALITERYKGLTSSLPPSSDKEFLRSKKRYAQKKEESHNARPPSVWAAVKEVGAAARRIGRSSSGPRPAAAASPTQLSINDLFASSPLHQSVLSAVRDVQEALGVPLYLCGGFVRNLVWDALHGYSNPTHLDDVDVVFVKEKDVDLEHLVLAALAEKLPNIPWSCRNLATVHPKVGSGNYETIDDAVRDFPETASAVVVHPNADLTLDVLAPLGTGDLLGGIVRPAYPAAAERVAERAKEKAWTTTWPRLQLLDLHQ